MLVLTVGALKEHGKILPIILLINLWSQCEQWQHTAPLLYFFFFFGSLTSTLHSFLVPFPHFLYRKQNYERWGPPYLDQKPQSKSWVRSYCLENPSWKPPGASGSVKESKHLQIKKPAQKEQASLKPKGLYCWHKTSKSSRAAFKLIPGGKPSGSGELLIWATLEADVEIDGEAREVTKANNVVILGDVNYPHINLQFKSCCSPVINCSRAQSFVHWNGWSWNQWERQ